MAKKQVENESVEQEVNNPEAETTQGEEQPQEALSPEEEIQDLKDQNLRLYAEFENFRRRSAKERLDLIQTAGEKIFTAILPILDDFDRALQNLPEDAAERQGMELISNKLMRAMEAEGLKRMPSTVGEVFDVESMEAVTQIPAPSPDQAGKVLDELESGYQIGNKIIRYAKVVVAQQA